MPKYSSPLKFSRCFGVPASAMAKLGAFDPILAVDTRLFIDPGTLRWTNAPELKGCEEKVSKFFRDLFKLLKAAKTDDDLWSKAAYGLWPKQEVKGTCLGYGSSIRGTSIKDTLLRNTLHNAREIIHQGVEDPDLFLLVGLFQPGIGSDTISDLVSNIIIEELANFTFRLCKELEVETSEFIIGGHTYLLPKNPTQIKNTPIVLVPADILRELPIALSFDEIWEVAEANKNIRDALNSRIASTWDEVTKKDKEKILSQIISDPSIVAALVSDMRDAKAIPYDVKGDPRGMILWADLAYSLAADYPAKIISKDRTRKALNDVVESVIRQFAFLMEKRDLWKVMQLVPTRQLEKVAQTLFFATAFSYCRSNNLDITPEADTGTGPVDFKFSSGLSDRILVELKLSKNNVMKGYKDQLRTYMAAEEARGAHYVVIDLGRLGRKWIELQEANKEDRQSGLPYTIWKVDGTAKESASRRATS